VAIERFSSKRILRLKEAFFVSLPAVFGSFFGSMVAARLDKEIFQKFVGIVFLVTAFSLIAKPKVWVEDRSVKRNWILIGVVFFLIGIYGGFIQAGVGFLLMPAIAFFLGYELVKTNAIKVFIVAFYNAIALLVFILNGKVNFLYGLVLGFGNMIGAWLAATFSVKKGAKWIRWIVFGAIVISGIRYLTD
jgi:uncharacterized membrane protein YfcA